MLFLLFGALWYIREDSSSDAERQVLDRSDQACLSETPVRRRGLSESESGFAKLDFLAPY